jgi:hypothetical protein
VQLRGRQDFVVDILDVGGLEAGHEGGDERRARRARVARVDDAGRVLKINLEVRGELGVDVGEGLVGRGVGKGRGVLLPGLLLRHQR